MKLRMAFILILVLISTTCIQAQEVVNMIPCDDYEAITSTTPFQSSKADTIHNGNVVFNSVLTELQNVSISLRMPSYLAAEELNDPSGLYAIVGESEEYKYSIQVATDPHCDWNTACLDGAIYGEQVSVTAQPENSQIVSLVNNIQGYFIESECNVSCSMAEIIWFENEVKYTIRQKAAPKQTMILIANSAIESSIGK